MKVINVISVIVLTASTFFAFQTTSLRVIVTDQNSDAVANATVRLKRKDGFLKEIKNAGNKTFLYSALQKGKYILEVEADGFTSLSQEIKLKSGANDIVVRLAIGDIKENVEVEVNQQDKSLDSKEGAFTGTLTKEEIEDLPDDPEELKKRLENIAGPGAIIRTDGFGGGQLPNKNQIAAIKIIRSSYDAEFHGAGRSYIDIVTRAGGSKWRGSFGGSFNDESLNARNAFALVRPSSQTKNFNYSVSGPIIKDKASISLFGFGNISSSAANINAILPDRQINETVGRSSFWSFNEGKFSYNMTKNHPLNIWFRQTRNNNKNFGVGGFNLRERGSDSNNRTNRLRVSTSGLVAKRYLHEFRFQFIDGKTRNVPKSFERAIVVLDSFSKGGSSANSSTRRKHFIVTENIIYGLEKHTLKFGVNVEYQKQRLDSANNQDGTYIFSSLNDFTQGRPSRFTQRPDARRIDTSQVQFSTYAQDDIRLHKTFMLSLGLRYEIQSNLKDRNNFSPRVGFSWSPQKKGKTVIRGGAGLYYNWLTPGNVSTIVSRDINQPEEIIILNPGFPNPFFGGINQQRISSYWQKSPLLKNPYVISSSIGISRRLGKSSSIRATYKYEKGVHQFRSRDINAPNANGIRPDANFGRIVEVDSSAFYVHNSFQLNFSTNLFKKVRIFSNYTLAKRTSDADGIFSLPSDNFNLRLDRAVSNRDQRHSIYGYAGWSIRKNIRLSTNFSLNSPTPYSITTGLDNNNDTVFNDRPIGGNRNTERGVWSKQIGANLSYTYSFGKAKGGKSSGSGMIFISGGAMPSFNKKKRFSLQFYISSQNLFNITNLRNFVGVQTSPFFGRAISAGSPRRINLGMRFSF